MTRAILAFLGVAALLALGVGWGNGLFRGPKTVVVMKPTAPSGHLSPDQLLTVTLEQLHSEALQRFYADPKNGFARMPTVYERVVKQWPPIWWSPGDLERTDVAVPSKDLEQIHSKSIGAFLAAKKTDPTQPIAIGFGINAELWKKIQQEKPTNWEAKSVDLVGLLKHDKPIVYVSEKLPDMKILHNLPTRDLDDFEMIGLKRLVDGEELFSRSQEGVVRLLGAVRAKADCLSCHDGKKEGDLLGAFSYTLREATYERRSNFAPRR